MTSKNYTYAQFLAAVMYNNDNVDQFFKNKLLEKYGDIIKCEF